MTILQKAAVQVVFFRLQGAGGGAAVVPSGDLIRQAHEKATITSTNVRRLEVLRKCVALIFDGKIADARKVSEVGAIASESSLHCCCCYLHAPLCN